MPFKPFRKAFTKLFRKKFYQKPVSLVTLLKLFKRKVYYDPLLSKEEIEGFGVKALDNLNVKMDCVIVAVAHDEFKNKPFLSTGSFFRKINKCIEVRGMFDGEEAKKKGFYYSRL